MHVNRDQKGAVPVFLLNALSLLYKTAALIHLKAKSLKPAGFGDALVISVDSLSFGGTGKTPAIRKIGEVLQAAGIRFAIITRGYRSRAESGSTEVKIDQQPGEVGDEALLFKEWFPSMDVYSGRRRVASIQKALKKNNRVILLDDGFQSTHIRRDIRIMLFNPNQPYYYLRHFKFLARGETLLFTLRGSAGPGIRGRPADGTYEFRIHRCRRAGGEVHDLKGEPLLAFSGLGDNRRFQESLAGFQIREFVGFPDHHPFSQDDLEYLERRRRELGADYLLCTRKDFIKIRSLDLRSTPLLYITNRIVFNYDLEGYLLKRLSIPG